VSTEIYWKSLVAQQQQHHSQVYQQHQYAQYPNPYSVQHPSAFCGNGFSGEGMMNGQLDLTNLQSWPVAAAAFGYVGDFQLDLFSI
jgi:hypothetical protein